MSEMILYTTPEGTVRVDELFREQTIWLTQDKIALLFGVDRTVITKHLKNIFESQELNEISVSAKFAHTASDGKTCQAKFYSLDAIISVGYRVNSTQVTQFRIWATTILKEYIIKGFAMDDERLKKSDKPSITPKIPNRPRSFSRKCRTRCFGRLPEKQPPKSSTREAILRCPTWDLLRGKAPSCAKPTSSSQKTI